jgi:hypothetical protein
MRTSLQLHLVAMVMSLTPMMALMSRLVFVTLATRVSLAAIFCIVGISSM